MKVAGHTLTRNNSRIVGNLTITRNERSVSRATLHFCYWISGTIWEVYSSCPRAACEKLKTKNAASLTRIPMRDRSQRQLHLRYLLVLKVG